MCNCSFIPIYYLFVFISKHAINFLVSTFQRNDLFSHIRGRQFRNYWEDDPFPNDSQIYHYYSYITRTCVQLVSQSLGYKLSFI